MGPSAAPGDEPARRAPGRSGRRLPSWLPRAGAGLAALLVVSWVVRGVIANRPVPVDLEPSAALTEAVDEVAAASPAPIGCGTQLGCFEGCAAPFALDRTVLWCRGNGGAPSPPAIAGSTVVTLRDTEIVAVDRATGAERWRVEAPRTGGAIPSVTDPLPDGRVLALVPDVAADVLVAYDLRDGHRAWVGPDRTGGTAVAVGDAVLVGGQMGHLTGVDVETGERRWQRSGLQAPYRAPVVEDDFAYTPWPSAVIGIDVTRGVVRWQAPVGADAGTYLGPFVSGAVGLVATDDGHVITFDAHTGGLGWSVSLDGGIDVAPALSADRAYVVTGDDRLVSLDLATGRTVAEVPIEGAIGGQRALSVTRDRVVLTTLTEIRLLDPESLATVETLDLGRAIVGSPVITGGTMFVTTQSALYAIDAG